LHGETISVRLFCPKVPIVFAQGGDEITDAARHIHPRFAYGGVKTIVGVHRKKSALLKLEARPMAALHPG
jgi:hypothetical protein